MIATIDPGMNTGVTIWRCSNFESLRKRNVTKINIPLIIYSVRTIKCEYSGKDHPGKIEDIRERFHEHMTHFPAVDIAYIESVGMWASSLKSVTSAKKGNLMLLSYIVGAICGVLGAKNIKVYMLQAREWKGQMNKDVVEARLKMSLGEDVYNRILARVPLSVVEHAMESMAMGVSLLGQL